jgi:acetyl-CoA acetyltransferase
MSDQWQYQVRIDLADEPAAVARRDPADSALAPLAEILARHHATLKCQYDAFTFTTMLQLEDYGFCKKGEGGNYVSDGTIRLGGKRPNNTSGGHLCEGYTHGLNRVIENVRQLRHDADDSCPIGPDGKRQHTYDYREGGCRQVKDVELTANLGWGTPWTGSALVLRRG